MNGTWTQPAKGAALLMALGLLLLASGCGKPAFVTARDGEFPLAEKSVRPEAIKDFPTLFDRNCRGCHGADGVGGPAPPLNDPLFLAIVPEAELRRVITEGRKDTMMPPFARAQGGNLTDEQVEILVRNLHAPEKWKKPAAPKNAPEYLATKKGNVEDGEAVFAMSCASCHGDKGQGGKAGPLNDPAFLTLSSDQFLRRIVITGRPDLGMPAYDQRDDKNFKPLTNQDVADVVAFVAAWRKPAR
jgi:cytochrome c oxidase cbb3-type subunit 3